MITSYFSQIKQEILSQLEKATTSIQVAMYWFTHEELFDKLCEKVQSGVEVTLLIHLDYVNNRASGLDFQVFIQLGGKLYFAKKAYPMHHKFCIIDNHTLINGSYNWTYYAEMKNSENILVIQDEPISIQNFYDEFELLKQKAERIHRLSPLSIFELDEYNDLNVREYLANDMMYQAQATGRTSLLQTAFQLVPHNVKLQEEANRLELTSKRVLTTSIGSRLIDDKYLIIVKRGSSIPISKTETVVTIKDNQERAYSSIFYGENSKASQNKHLLNLTLHRIPKKPKGMAKIRYHFSIDINGKLSIKKYSLDNGMSIYQTIDINHLLVEEHKNSLSTSVLSSKKGVSIS
jgi:hypothetical protein